MRVFGAIAPIDNGEMNDKEELVSEKCESH